MDACISRLVGSLCKVFPDEVPEEVPARLSALLGETVSFQVALYSNLPCNQWVSIEVESALSPWLRVREVKLCPSSYPCNPSRDDDYLRTAPGMFPDRLAPLEDGRYKLIAGNWRSLWIDVEIAEDLPSGVHSVAVSGKADEELFRARAEIEVLPVSLPVGKVYHSEWFYADCIADYYRLPVFGDRHFEVMENFIRTAVKRGVNTILTPLFTPALDVLPGGERTTTQLVGVRFEQGVYDFDFSLFERWVDMCGRCGITHYEMSSFFTVWGAKFAPKIIVTTDGRSEARFGWHTRSGDPAYVEFLNAFLPQLIAELRRLGLEKRCFFHISDEPDVRDLGSYMAAKVLVAPHLEGFPIIDSLRDLDFYKSGAVGTPVCATNHIELFLAERIPGLWAYYCCGQDTDVSNRFFAMPSARNRILGVQLYKFGIAGFLHWGYNFYNAQNSAHRIDPYAVTDAEDAFPSGDPFLVYPGADGMPEESIRLMVLAEAFQDVRALYLLEGMVGRSAVLAFIDREAGMEITFSKYPRAESFLPTLREKLNCMIAKESAKGKTKNS